MTVAADAAVSNRPPSEGPPSFHLLAKPSGSTCNIDCTYCFFLSKDALYPNEKHRMSQETLETYIRQLLESHRSPEVTVAWQGGEPTLMKVEFFERSIQLVEKHRKPGQTVRHTFQTNGILLDDAWCAFFKKHDVLVGLSVDGPREIHDTYRLDRRQVGTFDKVMDGWRKLRAHEVDFNILCTVNAANEKHGATVYRFFRDELKATWVQFIPIVERATAGNDGGGQQGLERPARGASGRSTPSQAIWSPSARSAANNMAASWSTSSRSGCATTSVRCSCRCSTSPWKPISAGTCCASTRRPAAAARPWSTTAISTPATTSSSPDYKLGNIHKTHMRDLVALPAQRKFGLDKRDTLTAQCQACDARALCNGGCPKDRFAALPRRRGGP